VADRSLCLLPTVVTGRQNGICRHVKCEKLLIKAELITVPEQHTVSLPAIEFQRNPVIFFDDNDFQNGDLRMQRAF